MPLELLDLRTRRNSGLLRRAYDELYLATFIDPDEQETFEQYRSRLFDSQLLPPQPVTHFVVAGQNLESVEQAALLGFIIFEAYRESGCGLLTYIVTTSNSRGRGLGRRLIETAQAALRADMEDFHHRPDALQAIFAEMHDPALVPSTQDVFDPALRLQIMRRFGAAQVPIHYVQPELTPGGERSRQLLLTVFPTAGEEPVAMLSQSVAADFLHEFYRALGVADPNRDADFLAMLRDLDNARHSSGRTALSGLPLVTITE